MMSKKNYEAMASQIADYVLFKGVSLSTHGSRQEELTAFMIEFFNADNPRFDEDRFRARIDQRIETKNPYGPLSKKR